MASPGAMPAACGLKITVACIPSRIPALSDSRSLPSMLLSLGYLPEAEAYAGYSQRLKQYNGEGRVKSRRISAQAWKKSEDGLYWSTVGLI